MTFHSFIKAKKKSLSLFTSSVHMNHASNHHHMEHASLEINTYIRGSHHIPSRLIGVHEMTPLPSLDINSSSDPQPTGSEMDDDSGEIDLLCYEVMSD